MVIDKDVKLLRAKFVEYRIVLLLRQTELNLQAFFDTGSSAFFGEIDAVLAKRLPRVLPDCYTGNLSILYTDKKNTV